MTTAIVAGSARCLFDDLARAVALEPDAQIIAVNLTGLVVPAILHLAGLHPDFIACVAALRPLMDGVTNPRGETVQVHSVEAYPGVHRVWPEIPRSGSSSLFAVRVGLALGFSRVICCGVPLDSSGRFFDPPGPPRWDWAGDDGNPYRDAWELAAAEEFQGKVRSCSGWTAKLLGAPTP